MSRVSGGRVVHGSAFADVVVVGAGPYGLSVAAHLLERGLEVAVFGKPMSLWCEHMPRGMLLRSYWWATSLSDPRRQYSLEQYLRVTSQQATDPLPGETIANYGLWFQHGAVPHLDQTYVARIERAAEHFIVTLADGRVLRSPAVVMALGLQYFVYRPAQYDHMPPELVSHTYDHERFDFLTGKRVAVIGGGQSALESAALLHESGAEVHLVHRSPLHWLGDEFDGKPHPHPPHALPEGRYCSRLVQFWAGAYAVCL